jgi:hypothetical protein
MRTSCIYRLLPCLICLCAGSAAAAEQPVIYSGGRAWPLIRSENQLLVRSAASVRRQDLLSVLSAKAAAARVLPEHPHLGNRLQVVQVARADEAAVQRLAATPQVELVTYVYRLQPDGPALLLNGNVLVGFRHELTDEQIAALCRQYGAQAIRPLARLPKAYVLSLSQPNGRRSLEVAEAMVHDARIRFSHPDLILPKHAADIEDPLYPNQWHLNNTGQDGSTPDADIDAPEAWTSTEGAGATVAIYDDAIDVGHPDLAAAVAWTWDYDGEDADPSPAAAGENHGTAVSGVAVAQANDIGVRGSAPLAALIAQRWGGPVSDDVQALYDADLHGADVHSNSWSYTTAMLPDAMRLALEDLYTNGRGGLGLLVFFAAGNDAGPIAENSPIAAMPETFAVGASTNLDTHAAYSNTGPELDLVAPSNGGTLAITTTDVRDGLFPTNGYDAGDYTDSFGGTSSATPLTAGTAALCLAANANLTAVQLRAVLEHTADPIGSGYDPTTSHSDTFGYGRLNAAAAVQASLQAAGNGGYTWPDHVTDLTISYAQRPILQWANPPIEAATVMVVRSANAIAFAPQDGTTYSLGQAVAPAVEVVFNELDTSVTDDTAPEGDVYYAIFVRNDLDRWSWGVTAHANGPTVPPRVVSLDISGPTQIDEDSQAQFQATAHFNDASTLRVTSQAQWSASPQDVLTALPTPGRVQAAQVEIDRTALVSASYTDQQSNTVTDSLRITVLNVSPEPTPPENPNSSNSPPACCGAAGPVSPLGLAAGMLLLARRNRRGRTPPTRNPDSPARTNALTTENAPPPRRTA